MEVLEGFAEVAEYYVFPRRYRFHGAVILLLIGIWPLVFMMYVCLDSSSVCLPTKSGTVLDAFVSLEALDWNDNGNSHPYYFISQDMSFSGISDCVLRKLDTPYFDHDTAYSEAISTINNVVPVVQSFWHPFQCYDAASGYREQKRKWSVFGPHDYFFWPLIFSFPFSVLLLFALCRPVISYAFPYFLSDRRKRPSSLEVALERFDIMLFVRNLGFTSFRRLLFTGLSALFLMTTILYAWWNGRFTEVSGCVESVVAVTRYPTNSQVIRYVKRHSLDEARSIDTNTTMLSTIVKRQGFNLNY